MLGILAARRRWSGGGSQLALVGLVLCGAPSAHASTPERGSLTQAPRQVAEQEYQARRARRGLQAPNRIHNLRAYFEPEGVRLHDRTAAGEPELMALRLARLGRPGSERPVPPGQVSSTGSRVEIRRPGLVEWYLNGTAGLEQGFTLDRRPAGAGRLVLALALSSATARGAGAGAAALRAANGRELRYGGLAVVDARGHSLPAELRVTAPDELRIEVGDAAAVYPLTVDPLVSALPDAILQADQASAQLGLSVAGAGDVNGDGYADVIVGAPYFDAGQVDEGAAFVFLGGPNGIPNGNPSTASATLQSDQASAYLGYSVAAAGDVNGDGYADVIVGAPNYDAGQADEGAAFVFLGGASGIPSGSPATASATLQSNQVNAQLGVSVAGAGDVNGDGYADVVVGAGLYDAGQTDEGAAFVFMGGPSGIPNGNPATAAATLQSDQASANLVTVAGAGDVNGDGFDDVIVGADSYDAGQTDEGAAFVFLGGPNGIPSGNPTTASATIQSNQASAYLAGGLAGAGDVNGDGYDDVIVGAGGYDAGQTDEGAAFVFLGGPSGIASGSPATASATFQSNQAGALMGVGVAGAGDVNGDTYADVVVGAPLYDAGEGAAFVFLGGPTGIASGDPTSARTTLRANHADAHMGTSVAAAGDVNGDGNDDVIVGASGYDEGGDVYEGGAFLFLGGFSKGDLDNDLNTDLVLRYQPTGANQAWLMNGTTRAALLPITPDPVGLDQRIAGIDDFNRDWHNDLVFWNPLTGATEFWLMNGAARVGAPVPLASPLAPPWKLSATADFTRDGHPDLVWRNAATQKIVVWTMNQTVHQGTLVPIPDQAVDANWEIVAALDWNGDHNTDFLWYNSTSGKIVLWFMDAAVHRLTGQFTVPPNAGDNNWNVVAAGDYGIGPGGLPGTKDIVWRNATSGNIVVWRMDRAGNRTSGGFTNPSAPNPNPTSWTIVGPK